MIAAIYIRVSTETQVEKGYSLSSQLEQCHDKAKSLGITLIEEFIEEGYSGAYIERPALDRLREGLREKRFSHVIVYDPDRMARNLAHQLIITEEIEKSGAQLVFVNFTWENTPEGMLFYSMRGAISAYEREKIKQRTTIGKRKKAKSGKVVKNANPYGYKWDKQNSTYIVDEVESEVIKEIFSCLVDKKMGLRSIAERLASLGYLTKRGKVNWRQNTIHGIVYNEVYSGTHWANKYYRIKTGQNEFEYGLRDPAEWIAVPVPAIITKERQEAAWEQLKLNRNETKKPREYPYLCRGLMYCGICGGRMRSLTNSKWTRTKSTPYYICQTGKGYITGSFNPNDEKCPARSVPSHEVDEIVWGEVNELLKSEKRIRKKFSGKKEENSQVRILKSNLKRQRDKEDQLLREQEKIALLFRQDLLNQESAEKQLGEIKQSLKALLENRNSLETEITRFDNGSEIEAIVERFKAFAGYADTQDLDERRTAIKALVKAVEVVRTDTSNGGRTHKLELKINIRY